MSKFDNLSIEPMQVPTFSNEEIARLLRSAVRDFHEAIRILDSSRQSETAGRLHALSVELRELASDTETYDVTDAICEAQHVRYMQ